MDEAVTNEPINQNEGQKRRQNIIKPLVENRFPTGGFAKTIAESRGIAKENLDKVDKREAQRLSDDYSNQGRDLIDEITEKEIKDEELVPYFQEMFSFANSFLSGSQKPDIKYYRNIVANCKDIKRIRIFHELSVKWKNEFLNEELDPKNREQRISDFFGFMDDVSDRWKNPGEPNKKIRTEEDVFRFFNAYAELYSLVYSLPAGFSEELKTILTGRFSIKFVGLETEDADQISQLVALWKEVYQTPDQESLPLFLECSMRYAKNHGLSNESRAGLVQNLLPAIQRKDPQIKILLEPGNLWAMQKGDFGIADFLCHCYAKKITPQNLNELVSAIYDIHTTDYNRMQQNQKDALVLVYFFNLRDMIHDQIPGIHDLISAMIDYYENPENDEGSKSKLVSSLIKCGYIAADSKEKDSYLDRSLYEKIFETDVDGERKKEKAIDILKRLKENTCPRIEEPPVTSDENLNQKMLELKQNAKDKIKVKECLEATLDYVNEKIINFVQTNQIGVEPNFVLALAYLNRQAFLAMQALTYEDQIAAFKQSWFYSVLKFQELTCSASSEFQEDNFSQFISSIYKADSDVTVYKIVQMRVLENVKRLADYYVSIGKPDWVRFLWTGNLTDQLIGLTELRPAETIYGRQHRKERINPEVNRRGD